MNSISIGSAMVQYMSTLVSTQEAETFLAVFIALADAEKDVSLISMKKNQTKFSFVKLYGIAKAMEFDPENYSSIVACQPLIAKIKTSFQAV